MDVRARHCGIRIVSIAIPTALRLAGSRQQRLHQVDHRVSTVVRHKTENGVGLGKAGLLDGEAKQGLGRGLAPLGRANNVRQIDLELEGLRDVAAFRPNLFLDFCSNVGVLDSRGFPRQARQALGLEAAGDPKALGDLPVRRAPVPLAHRADLHHHRPHPGLLPPRLDLLILAWSLGGGGGLGTENEELKVT